MMIMEGKTKPPMRRKERGNNDQLMLTLWPEREIKSIIKKNKKGSWQGANNDSQTPDSLPTPCLIQQQKVPKKSIPTCIPSRKKREKHNNALFKCVARLGPVCLLLLFCFLFSLQKRASLHNCIRRFHQHWPHSFCSHSKNWDCLQEWQLESSPSTVLFGSPTLTPWTWYLSLSP